MLLGNARGGSTALSFRNCVITPGCWLMRTWYRTCFHTYEKKKKICIRVVVSWLYNSVKGINKFIYSEISWDLSFSLSLRLVVLLDVKGVSVPCIPNFIPSNKLSLGMQQRQLPVCFGMTANEA